VLPPESLAIIAGAGVVGEALAVRMAQDGAAVAVLDLNPDRAGAVRDRAAALGTRAIAVQTDLGSTQSVEAAVKTVVSQLGEPSVLVNVVGGMAMFAGHRPLYEWTDHDWELIRALNYEGARQP
jgi:NAD(P)-dependent dehydrogenase (short-subunit alcohol dehydrogenase family)